MSFIQPLALFGLALCIIPVVIHMLNLFRHRKQDWAAVIFIDKALKKSSKFSKIRNFLTLLFRTLCLIFLSTIIARPVWDENSAWFILSEYSEPTIVHILDRSASMERQMQNSSISLREEAIRRIKNHEKNKDRSRVLVFDCSNEFPFLLNSEENLDTPKIESLLVATDKASNLPRTLDHAMQWLQKESVERAELFVYSDMQKSSWELGENRLKIKELDRLLAEKDGRWKITFCALSPNSSLNRSLTSGNINQGTNLLIQKNKASEERISLEIKSDTNSYFEEIKLSSPKTIFKTKLSSKLLKKTNWVQVELPEDSCPNDNAFFMTKSSTKPAYNSVCAEDENVGRILQAASLEEDGELPPFISPNSMSPENLTGVQFLIFQGAEKRLLNKVFQDFIVRGGVIIKFPSIDDIPNIPVKEGNNSFALFPVTQWNKNQGILRDSESGQSLPFSFLQIYKRENLKLGAPLSYFSDGTPFLTQQVLGKGFIYRFSTLPLKDYSNLEEGFVLVPIIERIFKSHPPSHFKDTLLCGTKEAASLEGAIPITGNSNNIPFINAGIYQKNNQFFAVNRPAEESDIETLNALEIVSGSHTYWNEGSTPGSQNSDSEHWKLFLLLLLLVLLMECFFSLPRNSVFPNRIHEL